MNLSKRPPAVSRSVAAAMISALVLPATTLAEGVRCGATDMRAELARSDAALYADVLEESAATSNAMAVLWRVDMTGRPPSYLFGTMHSADERITTLSPATENAVASAKTLVVEVINLARGFTAADISNVAPLLYFADGRRLDALLTADEFAKAVRLLTQEGIPAESVSRFKPWAVSLLMPNSRCEMEKSARGIVWLDQKLENLARARGIAVVGLETAAQQLASLAAVPEDQQLAMLRFNLNQTDRRDDQQETDVRLYVERHLGEMMPFTVARAVKAGFPRNIFAGFLKEAITVRNRKMRDNLLPVLEQGGAFVGVGALHLPGPEGLVELLREAGYRVTPLD